MVKLEKLGEVVVRWYQSRTKQPSDKSCPSKVTSQFPPDSPAMEHSLLIGPGNFFSAAIG